MVLGWGWRPPSSLPEQRRERSSRALNARPRPRENGFQQYLEPEPIIPESSWIAAGLDARLLQRGYLLPVGFFYFYFFGKRRAIL